MVLETSWGTPSGWIIVRDLLLMGPWHHEDERSKTHRRAPTDYDADHVLLRTVRCVNGEVQVVLDCEPMFDYGRRPVEWAYSGDGLPPGRRPRPRARPRADADHRPPHRLRGWPGDGPHAAQGGRARFCALSWSEHAPPSTSDEAYDRLVWTAHHWQHWLARGHFPDHPWRGYLQRSALTLKGLTFAPTGALVAAATTSLPETPGGRRNWDYRYSWIRDATFALWALYTLGFDWEANDFFWFIADVAERDEDLQVMYGVDGRAELPEEEPRSSRGLRGRPTGARRQRRVPAAPARRVGCRARLGLPPHQDPRRARRAASGRSSCTRSRAPSPPGGSRTRASGRSAESRSTSRRPSSCAGWPSTAAPAWPA